MASFPSFRTITEAVLHRNSELNPALWNGDALKPEVRTALLNYGEAWRRFARVPEGAVVDVILVGGNAGFYYNEDSDLDVHLVTHVSELGLGPAADEFLRDKKALWTARHDVRVRGYQVEPYVQDASEPPVSGQGIYSLLHGRWIQRPVESDYDPVGDGTLERKAAAYRKAIDGLVERDADDEEFDGLKNKLGDMRSRAIAKGGELARGNLVYKSLRLSGHLNKMQDFVRRRTGERLSLA